MCPHNTHRDEFDFFNFRSTVFHRFTFCPWLVIGNGSKKFIIESHTQCLAEERLFSICFFFFWEKDDEEWMLCFGKVFYNLKRSRSRRFCVGFVYKYHIFNSTWPTLCDFIASCIMNTPCTFDIFIIHQFRPHATSRTIAKTIQMRLHSELGKTNVQCSCVYFILCGENKFVHCTLHILHWASHEAPMQGSVRARDGELM